MLISLPELVSKYDLKIKGVVQVGAHWAQEHPVYKELGIENLVYIEPCVSAFNRMYINVTCSTADAVSREYVEDGVPVRSVGDHIKLFRCACGSNDEVETKTMFVSPNNQGQSNSLLKPELHLKQHPEVKFTENEDVLVVRLDKLSFDREKYNLLVMDCQGFEGEVLKGAIETLPTIDCIYTEVNNGQTYKDNMEIDEMDKFLGGFGFKRVETHLPSKNWTWGDAVYLRNELIK